MKAPTAVIASVKRINSYLKPANFATERLTSKQIIYLLFLLQPIQGTRTFVSTMPFLSIHLNGTVKPQSHYQSKAESGLMEKLSLHKYKFVAEVRVKLGTSWSTSHTI